MPIILFVARVAIARLSPLALVAALLTPAIGDATMRLQNAGDDPPARFSLEEELRIDWRALEFAPIDTIVRVVVAPNGTIAIADRRGARIRFFSPEGAPLGGLGTLGREPGQFITLWRLGLRGDTIHAYDFDLRRFTLIGPDPGRFRTVAVPVAALPGPDLAGVLPTFASVYGGTLLADGSMFVEMRDPMGPGSGFDPRKMTYGRVAPDGTILSWFQFDDGEVTVSAQTAQGTVEISMGFGGGPDRPRIGISDNGVQMGRVQITMEGPDAGTYEVTMEEVIGGEVLYRRRFAYDPVPMPDAVRERLLDQRARSLPEDLIVPFREAARLPPHRIPVTGLIVGRDGTLWIRMVDTLDGREYRVLDPAGEPVGSLQLPLNARIAVAERGRIWTIEVDASGQESVVGYRVLETG